VVVAIKTIEGLSGRGATKGRRHRAARWICHVAIYTPVDTQVRSKNHYANIVRI
jgi:hypothetical protein